MIGRRRTSQQLLVGCGLALAVSLSGACRRDEPGSPGAALRAFLYAANEKRYDDVEAGLAADARQFLKTEQAASAGGIRGYAASATKNHTVTSYKTRSVRITGTRALVDCEMSYEGGESTVGPVAMIFEGGTWKVALYSADGGEAWLQEK